MRQWNVRWSVVTAIVAVVAVAVGALALAVASRGGAEPPGPPPILASVADLPATPRGLGRCRAVLHAGAAERTSLAEPLRGALERAGRDVDASAVADILGAACQAAPPGAHARHALARLATRRAPGAHVCAALRADRRAAMRTVAGAVGSARSVTGLLSDESQPSLEELYRALRRSEGLSRRAARSLRTGGARTHAGRELREELSQFAADWAHTSASYRGGSPTPGALVRSIGAASAVDRLERWFRGLSRLRARSESVQALANATPVGAPRSCVLTQIALLD